MGNVLQFIIQLKDQMSAGVMGAASNVNRAFEGMNRRVHATGRSISDINTRLAELRRSHEISVDTRQIANARRQIDALERQRNRLSNLGSGSSSTGLGLGGLVKGFVGYQALSMAGSGIASALRTGSQMQTSQTGLKTFLGDKGAASAFSNIQKDAAATPYDTQTLLQVNRALISAGLSAKNARADAMNLANAISAVGGGNDELARMAANMQQIKTVGKATAMDIKQFGIAGINIYQMLAEVTGKNINQVKDMDVSYEVLSAALAKASSAGGMYAGALDAQSKTMGGRWNTLVDNVQMSIGKMVLSFEPFINRIIDMGISFSEMIPTFVKYLEPVFATIKNVVVSLIPVFAALKPLFVQIFRTATPLFTKIGEFISTAVHRLAPTLINIANIVSNILGPALKIIGPMLGKLLDVLGWILGKIASVLEGITYVFSKISEGVGWLFDKIGDTVTPKINHIKEVIKAGISDDRMAQFFKKVGELHGTNYMYAMLGKMSQAALWADKFYKTTLFTDKLRDIKTSMSGKGVVVTPGKSTGQKYNFGGSEGESKSKVKDHTESITGGGAKNIYITLGKFQDQLNIHTMTVKEGVNEMEAMIENSLLRILNSANAISN